MEGETTLHSVFAANHGKGLCKLLIPVGGVILFPSLFWDCFWVASSGWDWKWSHAARGEARRKKVFTMKRPFHFLEAKSGNCKRYITYGGVFLKLGLRLTIRRKDSNCLSNAEYIYLNCKQLSLLGGCTFCSSGTD